MSEEGPGGTPEIIQTDGVLGGKPRLEGYRISVADIIEHRKVGESVDEIAENLQLMPSEIEAALEYYSEHQEEIDDQLRARRDLYHELVGSDNDE